MDRLKKLFGPGGSHASDKVVLVEHEKAKSRQHVIDKLKEVETLGGEGIMLRKPGSQYEGKRSSTLLKLKVRPLYLIPVLFSIFYVLLLSLFPLFSEIQLDGVGGIALNLTIPLLYHL